MAGPSDLTAIMDALAAAVPTGTTSNVFGYPVEGLTPPAVVIGFPDIDFDAAFGNASDVLSFPVWYIAGKSAPNVERDAIADAIAGTNELKAAFEGSITGASSQRVQKATPTTITLGGIVYFGYEFTLEVYT